jgi:glycosyltransferase involved in cell wall biosynthesis
MTKRIAVYHNLSPGGALRAAYELVRHTRHIVDYDLFAMQIGWGVPLGRMNSIEAVRNLFGSVNLYRAPPRLAQLARSEQLRPFINEIAVRRTQHRVADDINRGNYDAVVVHPCQVTQTPSLLGELERPALYFMQEPRRKSFERSSSRVDPGQPFQRRVGGWVLEQARRKMDVRAADDADHLLCNSVFSRESIFRSYGRDAELVYLGVDHEIFSLPADDSRSDYVLVVGGLEPAKHHELAVEALSLLPKAVRPRLVIVSERAVRGFRENLIAQSSSMGVKLEILHGLSDEELAAAYAHAQATLCLARLEPFGLTTVESLACGTPVVAVREGGYREVVKDGKTGFLVTRNPGEVATALQKLQAGALSDREAIRESIVPFWTWASAGQRFAYALDRFFDATGR